MEREIFPLFGSFIRDLGKTYPEIKSSLYRNYEECLVDTDTKSLKDCPKLHSFLEIVHRQSTQITKKDPAFFDNDLLDEISFQGLWSKHISEKTRATIWRYFQTFSLLAINLKSSQELQDALSSIQKDEEVEIDLTDRANRSVAKDLQKVKQLTQGLQEGVSGGGEGEMDLDGMLGGLMDSNIGKIAQEVAGTLDMEAMFGNVDESTNPMELMSQMMNPDKMGSIFKNIHSVMEKQMEDGSLNQEDLKKEAEGMYGNMAQNPMFASMMGQMQGAESGSEPGAEPGAERSKEEMRKDLKVAIRAKENERLGKT